jgi:hypothetical protein
MVSKFYCTIISEKEREYGYWNDPTTTTTQSPVPSTYSPWTVRQQQSRKAAIMFRLWMDPTIAVNNIWDYSNIN